MPLVQTKGSEEKIIRITLCFIPSPARILTDLSSLFMKKKPDRLHDRTLTIRLFR